MNAEFTGKQIAQRRKALGLTQKELAQRLHVTDKAVSKWERGINFPDLGLMEALSQVLETTPAVLLGLEEADRDQALQSVARLSCQQLEDSRRELMLLGWGCIAASVLLLLFDVGIGALRALAWQILYCLILLSAIGGSYLLFKYGEIRKWNSVDWLVTYAAVLPLVVTNGAYLFADRGLPDGLELALTLVSLSTVQLLFYRVMRPRLAKALPAILAAGFLLWHSLDGALPITFALGAICPGITWLILRSREPSRPALPKRKVLAATAATLLILCVFCYSSLTQVYVEAFHRHLEAYATQLLEESTGNISYHRYGFWKVTVYPQEEMVQFLTGGSGLTPSSSYEGFYYSADNSHLPFQCADVEMTVNVDSARWTDGTDNRGSSRRLLENWFWFEASF